MHGYCGIQHVLLIGKDSFFTIYQTAKLKSSQSFPAIQYLNICGRFCKSMLITMPLPLTLIFMTNCRNSQIYGNTHICAHVPTHTHYANTHTHTHLQSGWTPLICAAIKGHEKVVELLLTLGANPNIRDKV